MCYFFKKIKKMLQYTFEKNNLFCKKREKNNLSRGKIPAPLDIKWSIACFCYSVRPICQNGFHLFIKEPRITCPETKVNNP